MLDLTDISVDFTLNKAIWLEAGLRYARYGLRRRKATKEPPRRLIADYVIGAHALLSADRLMSFDTQVYRKDFPELRLYPEPPQ